MKHAIKIPATRKRLERWIQKTPTGYADTNDVTRRHLFADMDEARDVRDATRTKGAKLVKVLSVEDQKKKYAADVLSQIIGVAEGVKDRAVPVETLQRIAEKEWPGWVFPSVGNPHLVMGYDPLETLDMKELAATEHWLGPEFSHLAPLFYVSATYTFFRKDVPQIHQENRWRRWLLSTPYGNALSNGILAVFATPQTLDHEARPAFEWFEGPARDRLVPMKDGAFRVCPMDPDVLIAEDGRHLSAQVFRAIHSCHIDLEWFSATTAVGPTFFAMHSKRVLFALAGRSCPQCDVKSGQKERAA